MTAVETIFGLLERGFDWGIWDVSFSHANLGITQIFLYFLAGLACALLVGSRKSGNHANLLLVSLGEIGGIGVRFTWGLLIRQHSVSEMLRI